MHAGLKRARQLLLRPAGLAELAGVRPDGDEGLGLMQVRAARLLEFEFKRAARRLEFGFKRAARPLESS